MFEKIVFKNQSGYGALIDIGAIAEALLFYGHVLIVANSATIKYLLQKIPPFVLLDLVRVNGNGILTHLMPKTAK